VQAIAIYFWQLCLFRRHPAELPNRPSTAALILAIYLIVITPVGLLSYPARTFVTTLAIISIGICLQSAILYLLLLFKGVSTRFPSVIGNMLGTGILMSVLLLPVNLVLLQSETEILVTIANALTWAWLGWWLSVSGFILSKSMHISIVQGALIAFVIELLSVITSFTLFPSN
jgi:hypothetical protein